MLWWERYASLTDMCWARCYSIVRNNWNTFWPLETPWGGTRIPLWGSSNSPPGELSMSIINVHYQCPIINVHYQCPLSMSIININYQYPLSMSNYQSLLSMSNYQCPIINVHYQCPLSISIVNHQCPLSISIINYPCPLWLSIINYQCPLSIINVHYQNQKLVQMDPGWSIWAQTWWEWILIHFWTLLKPSQVHFIPYLTKKSYIGALLGPIWGPSLLSPLGGLLVLSALHQFAPRHWDGHFRQQISSTRVAAPLVRSTCIVTGRRWCKAQPAPFANYQ